MDYLNGTNQDKKQEVFDWVVDRLSDFVGKKDPNFRWEQLGPIMILQVDQEGFRNTQMSQDSLSIEHDKGQIVNIHKQPFRVNEQPSKSECLKTQMNEEDDDVMITNDDNADISLPTNTTAESYDHAYAKKRLSLSKKNLPAIRAVKVEQKQEHIPANVILKPIVNAIPKKSAKSGVKKPAPKPDSQQPSSSSLSSQGSILNLMDSDSDNTPDDYYDNDNEDEEETSEDDTLQDIPHTIDPVIAKFAEESQRKSIAKGGYVKSSQKKITEYVVGGNISYQHVKGIVQF